VRRPPPAVGGPKRPITPEGHAKLQADLQALERERASTRPASAERADVEARMALVQATLDGTVLTEPSPGERAFFGAHVELEDEGGERVTYRLVGPDEADARAGQISVQAPLGRALLGREAGDEVIVERPRGRATFTVLRVSYGAPE
jgi:transcription elongation factor GreB